MSKNDYLKLCETEEMAKDFAINQGLLNSDTVLFKYSPSNK